MGIDIPSQQKRKSNRASAKTENIYMRLLVKLYTFLARRTDSAFNATVLKRLYMSKSNRAPVSLSRIARLAANKSDATIVVAVANVVDDVRLLDVPKVAVAALRFSETARARIEAAGGRCLTFDQLATERPTGANCLLIRGPTKSREAVKHFGAAGVPNSHAKPYVRSKGRKFEKARGRNGARGSK